MRILLVEDDRELAGYLRRGLEEENNAVTVCFDGSCGLRAAQSSAFDIIVLDVMLPYVDGLQITKRLRLESVRTPILLLTARDAPEDVVRGLDAGADDYLTKPFSFEVLLARLRARTRSPDKRDATRMRFADLTMDLETREVRRGNSVISLTRTEFAMLECLMKSAGRVVTRARLTDFVWGEREINSNNLEVFIRFLRAKIDPPDSRKLIQTERGIGYSLRESG
jgi:DNA-binding response OmpR family regulator